MHFVFDLDGTLCFDRMTIDAQVLETLALATDYGHEVTFATARSYRDSLPLLKDLGQCRVIGLNGGIVYEKGELVTDKPLDPVAYQEALDYCHQYDLPYFVDNDFDYSHYRGEYMPFIASVDPLGLAHHKAVTELKHPIKMVICLDGKEEHLAELRTKLEAFASLDITYDAIEHCLYLNPYQTTKATTLLEVLDGPYIAFGNDQNDIAMFKQAHYAVQVGDFTDLTPYADHQLSYNEQIVSKLSETIKGLFEVHSLQ